jgi:hypothetical protein
MGPMTLSPTDGTAATPPNAPVPASTRVVVIVPRREPGLHEYLQRALACIKDVEVVLDRRAAAATPADDRRRRPEQTSARQLLICSMVHCPIEAPAPATPPPAPAASEASGRPRTLLWPDLRLEHL